VSVSGQSVIGHVKSALSIPIHSDFNSKAGKQATSLMIFCDQSMNNDVFDQYPRRQRTTTGYPSDIGIKGLVCVIKIGFHRHVGMLLNGL
jgi:hypothetical protein